MRLRRALIAAALAALCVLASASARAQDTEADARARRHFDAGTAYFEVGDYEGAVRELSRAYEISHRPALLYNIYAAYERLGRFAEAASSLERYLADEPDVENRAALEERLARVRERAASTSSQPPPSTPPPDAAAPAAVAAPQTAPPPTAPSSPSSSSDPPLLTISGFTLAGVGVVMFAIGGGIVLSEDARLRPCSPGCAPGEVATLDAATIVADVGLGAALLGGILGLVGIVVEGGSAPATERAGDVSLRGRSVVVTF